MNMHPTGAESPIQPDKYHANQGINAIVRMGMFFAEVFLITSIQNRGRMQTASHTALSTMTSSLIQHQQTGDFEHQASLLKGWNQDYLQLSAGAFEGYVSELYLRDMHLFLEYTNQVLYQSGHLGEDVIAIGVPSVSYTHLTLPTKA